MTRRILLTACAPFYRIEATASAPSNIIATRRLWQQYNNCDQVVRPFLTIVSERQKTTGLPRISAKNTRVLQSITCRVFSAWCTKNKEGETAWTGHEPIRTCAIGQRKPAVGVAKAKAPPSQLDPYTSESLSRNRFALIACLQRWKRLHKGLGLGLLMQPVSTINITGDPS